VEDAGEVGAEGGEGFVAGVGAGDEAVAAEEEGGGDGADGGGAAEDVDDAGVGQADGEGSAEAGDFGGDLGDGAVIDDGADEGEAAVGEILLEPVPIGDGAAAGGAVGAEEEDELDLAGIGGGADDAGELGGEVLHGEAGDGGGRAGLDGWGFFLFPAAARRKKNQE